MKVKILGAGSIGNHLAHASRRLGHDVCLCDVDKDALVRAQTEIYPGRYGNWDHAINLSHVDAAPRGGFDLIIIGTPPDTHISLARAALNEAPKALLIEKPVSAPDISDIPQLLSDAKAAGVKMFVGYDHVLGEATEHVRKLLAQEVVGKIVTFDVEFREHWGGIFAAHPWLSGPQDTYLGYSEKGGGALCEHSHALNLWQHFSHVLGYGNVASVQADFVFVDDGLLSYDAIAALNIRSEGGVFGRVIQDIVTQPVRKVAVLQGKAGTIEWICGWKPGVDAVIVSDVKGNKSTTTFSKTRPDDFIREIQHIDDHLNGRSKDHHILIERGVETMMVISAAFQSSHSKCTVNIDWEKGYCSKAFFTELKPESAAL